MHRTYVRRRIATLVVALVAVMGLSGHMAGALDAVASSAPVSHGTYVVRQADTLWSIASVVSPERDPRLVVHELEVLNEGISDSLVPGQVLSLPPPA